jgi:hypothetical protein
MRQPVPMKLPADPPTIPMTPDCSWEGCSAEPCAKELKRCLATASLMSGSQATTALALSVKCNQQMGAFTFAGEIMSRLLQMGYFLLLGTLCLVPIQKTARTIESSTNRSTVQTRPTDNPIPSTFLNLQVLPKDIPKRDLVGIMKQFSITFGVRCSYCHSVSDDLTEGRFDSDEKPTKQKARELMKTLIEMGKSRGPSEPAPAEK